MKQEQQNSLPKDWQSIKLSDYGNTFTGLSGKTKVDFGSGKPYIPYLNIFFNPVITDGEFDFVKIKNNEIQSLVKNGDLFFTTSSETPEEVGMCAVYHGNEKELYLNSFCFGYRLNQKDEISTHFLAHLFRSYVGRKIIFKLAQGGTRYNLSKTNLLKEIFNLPTSLTEQKNIAVILSTWDSSIYKTQKLILQLQLRNKRVTQQLLSGKQRIKKFVKNKQYHKTSLGELPVDWKLNSIKNVLNPIKKSFTPEQDVLYQQIGIRSHAKGIFYKEKVTGKSLGEKSVFWIEPNCFIVNIVFAWEHAIARTTENEIGMIASHRFPMYKPKEGIIDLDYLLYFFKSPRGKHLLGLASPGGAGRNKTLGQSEFIKLQIPVPSLQEQIAIAGLLNEARNEIELLKRKLQLFKEQKKGLMQQLLTGKIRVKSE